jgi:hypothetical protein
MDDQRRLPFGKMLAHSIQLRAATDSGNLALALQGHHLKAGVQCGKRITLHGRFSGRIYIGTGRRLLPGLLITFKRGGVVLPCRIGLVVGRQHATGAQVIKLPIPRFHHRPHKAFGFTLIFRAVGIHKFFAANRVDKIKRDANTRIIARAASEKVA